MSALWQPVWQANHAYLSTAVVIPSVADGYTWRCTTPGTSAGVEPVWPVDPSTTPTIVDGGVTWTVGTAFRQVLSAAIVSLVTTFAAANPTIIRSVWTTKPNLSNAEMPCFYIGDLAESITHMQGVRTRTFSGFSAYLVDNPGATDESSARLDFAADALVDLFTANPHAASGRSIFQHVGTNDIESPDGVIPLPGLELLFAETTVTEGRT